MPLLLMEAMWPSKTYIDDRDTVHGIHSYQCPGLSVLSADNYISLTSLLSRWSSPLAAPFHSWVRAVRALNPAPAPWLDFLFWDDAAPESDYTALPRSYLAHSSNALGTNYAAMRSDWTSSATWASFRAMAYMDAPDNTHQYTDAGSLAITRGDTPFLVNPGFLDRCYNINNGVADDDAEWDNPLEAETINSGAPRQFFNIFYTSTTAGQDELAARVDRPSPPTTTITRFEDKNGYVLSRAEHLEDVYPSSANLTAWSREVVYLRPRIFVVYDRTTTTGTVDSHLSWNFAPLPATAAAPSFGATRWDVNDTGKPAPVGGFRGALTTLLPQGAVVSPVVNVFSSNKLYRVEVRSPSPAPDMRWLSVLDTSATSAGVALGSLPASLSSNVKGARLAGGGVNAVVLFGAGAAGQAVSGAVSFVEPAVSTTVVVADLLPNTSYAVTAPVSGGNHTVTIQPGTGFATSDNGTLYVVIAANGTPGAGN
jgi:hypothetical protein